MSIKNFKNYVPLGLRVVVSFLFLLSAVAKLYPSPYFAISTFEVKQLYPMGFTEEFASYFSRTLIGIEFALGILLLQPHYLKKLVVPATFLMLLIFSIHLSIQSFIYGGNAGNCGCFGSLLPMTPIQAIIKNVVAMGLLGYLYFLMPKESTIKNNFWILSTTVLGFILMLFMLAPIQPKTNFVVTPVESVDTVKQVQDTVSNTITTETSNETKKDSVIKSHVLKIDEPLKNKSGYASYFSKIDSGRKILCFFVPGCDHCRTAAKEMTEMKQKDKNFPELDILFMNEEADLIPEFFKVAGAQYPYKIIEIIPFWKMLGSGKDTPGVKYLWNGNELKYYYGITENKFNALDFSILIQKKYSEIKQK